MDWLFDLKYDGFRAVAYIRRGRCNLVSRNGNPFDRFAMLADQVAAALGVVDAVLDGEVIAADETGRPQFYDLLRRTRKAGFVRARAAVGRQVRPATGTRTCPRLDNEQIAGARAGHNAIYQLAALMIAVPDHGADV
jgi:ATP dependent DNA ligase domain